MRLDPTVFAQRMGFECEPDDICFGDISADWLCPVLGTLSHARFVCFWDILADPIESLLDVQSQRSRPVRLLSIILPGVLALIRSRLASGVRGPTGFCASGFAPVLAFSLGTGSG